MSSSLTFLIRPAQCDDAREEFVAVAVNAHGALKQQAAAHRGEAALKRLHLAMRSDIFALNPSQDEAALCSS